MAQKVIIGKFGKTFGVRGWLKIHSFTQPSENIVQFTPWFITSNQNNPAWKEITIQEWKQNGSNIIVLLPNISSPETAKIYTNQLIAVNRTQLPTLTTDEFYWEDLIGAKVVNIKGIELGEVDYLFATVSNDVLVVRDKPNQRERFIPYLTNIIIEVNITGTTKKIIVDWDEDF